MIWRDINKVELNSKKNTCSSDGNCQFYCENTFATQKAVYKDRIK